MNIQKALKAVKDKAMKKDSNYIKHLNDILNCTDIQKFNPFSLSDAIIKSFAVYNGANYIVTDKGCRAKRKRDYDKKVFAKTYILLGHCNGRHVQKWFAGNVLGLANDKRLCRIKGPSYYYIPAKLEKFVTYMVSNTCKALNAHYSEELSLNDLEKKIRRAMYAIDKKLKISFKKDFLEVVFKTITDFIKAGWRNHLGGGSFGRKSGRPTSKVTEKNTRPRLFVKKLVSEESQKAINEHLTSKGPWDKAKKHKTIKAITTYYASNSYLNSIKNESHKDSIEVVIYCMNKAPEVMNIKPEVMNNYAVKPVHNLFKTQINAVQYSYPVRRHFNQINTYSRKKEEKPQKPIENIKKYRKKEERLQRPIEHIGKYLTFNLDRFTIID